MKPFRMLFPLAAFGLILAACAAPANGDDPYADPGTAPPPTIEDPTIATTGTIRASDKGDDLMDISVSGFLGPDGEATDLDEGDFTVVEAGTVKGITVERIGGEVRAAADIVFVFDTTGSMGSGLTSVQNSIIAFSEFLDTSGLDARVGAVTFGDAYDTKNDPDDADERGVSLRGDTPPGFDSSPRPTFDLSADFEAFQTFIEGDSPRGGGDAPENAIGSVEFALDNLAWRDGAQKIMIVVMDICSHTHDTFESQFSGTDGWERWQPPVTEDLLDRLTGEGVVTHVVGPDSTFCDDTHENMKVFAGVDGTGGVFFDWDGSEFDLEELPIATAATGGYIVTFRGTKDGAEKTVRVVIDDGSDIRGEFSRSATY